MRMIFIIIITIIIIINIIIIIIIALSSLLLLNWGHTTTRFGSSQTTLRATQLLWGAKTEVIKVPNLHLISFPDPLSSTSWDTDKREGTGCQHKENVDHVRLKRSPQLLTFPTCRCVTDQNASSVYLCKALTIPSLYTNNKGATEWGTICQRAKSIFTSHSLLWKNSWNELGFRRTGGSLPVGPLAPPIVPCLCCEPTRDLPGTPSLLSSRHPESIPKPQSSTITLMLCHSGGTLENSQQSAGAAQAW